MILDVPGGMKVEAGVIVYVGPIWLPVQNMFPSSALVKIRVESPLGSPVTCPLSWFHVTLTLLICRKADRELLMVMVRAPLFVRCSKPTVILVVLHPATGGWMTV